MISCQFENGDKVGLRHVVTGAIVTRDNQVLLEKRGTFNGRPIRESGKWAIVGGFLDRDENLTEGIKREVREETGWEINNLTLLHINDSPKRRHEDRQNVAMIFIASPLRHVEVNSEEVTELKWFDIDALPPSEEFAFDHYKELELYKKYLKEKFPIPVLE